MRDELITLVGVVSVATAGIIIGVIIGEKFKSLIALGLSVLALIVSGFYTYIGYSSFDSEVLAISDMYEAVSNFSIHLTPLGISSGVLGGVILRRFQESAKNKRVRRLKRLYALIERDIRAERSSVIVAMTWIRIGFSYLKDFEDDKKALKAFDKAAELLSKQAGPHPWFGDFWRAYVVCLTKAEREDEAQHVEESYQAMLAEFFGKAKTA